jgi:hypothetical protein
MLLNGNIHVKIITFPGEKRPRHAALVESINLATHLFIFCKKLFVLFLIRVLASEFVPDQLDFNAQNLYSKS